MTLSKDIYRQLSMLRVYGYSKQAWTWHWGLFLFSFSIVIILSNKMNPENVGEHIPLRHSHLWRKPLVY